MARRFSIAVSANGTKAHYSFDTVLSNRFGWTGGDRVGYACAYAFLIDASAVAVARVTFTRIEYAHVNDKGMAEGARWYDGRVYVPAAGEKPRRQLNDCPGPSEPYEPHVGAYPTPPRITFRQSANGELIDVRDYATDPQEGTELFRYDFVGERNEDHVGFVAFQRQLDTEEDEPVFAVYYDRLDSGIVMASGGSTAG